MYAVTCEGGMEVEKITTEYKRGDFFVLLHRSNGNIKEFRQGGGILEVANTQKEISTDVFGLV